MDCSLWIHCQFHTIHHSSLYHASFQIAIYPIPHRTNVPLYNAKLYNTLLKGFPHSSIVSIFSKATIVSFFFKFTTFYNKNLAKTGMYMYVILVLYYSVIEFEWNEFKLQYKHLRTECLYEWMIFLIFLLLLKVFLKNSQENISVRFKILYVLIYTLYTSKYS